MINQILRRGSRVLGYPSRAAVLLIAVAIFGVAAGVVAASGPAGTDIAYRLGLIQRQSNLGSSTAAMIVNGEPITTRSIQLMRASLEANGVSASQSDAEARTVLIRQLVVAQEAARRGFAVSDKEVADWIAMQRAAQAQAAPEVSAPFRAFLAGLGMSEDAYWNDPVQRQSIRTQLAVSKLRGALGHEAFDQLVTRLTENAEVQNVGR